MSDEEGRDALLYELADSVLTIARDMGIRIACAESCTGGMVSQTITSVPGSSDAFLGGVVSYANSVKTKVLGVSEDDILRFGVVSSQVAAQMAEGACERLCADLAVSTTGLAGPGGGSAEIPVGTVWLAVHSENRRDTRLIHCDGSREDVRFEAAKTALGMLHEALVPF